MQENHRRPQRADKDTLIIMMPEYGHALCPVPPARRCCCPFTRCGVARGDADDGVGRGVRPGCCFIPLRGGRVFVLRTPLWLTTSPWPMRRRNSTRSCRVVPVAATRAHEGSLLPGCC